MRQWLLILACLSATLAWAQDWPTRTLRIIVPFAAASTPDTAARVLAESLRKRLGQAVIVENRAGAGGMIGTNAVARAAPDGYTIGISIVGPLVNNKLLYKSMPYDPDKDLAPITIAVTQPSLLVVPANREIRNLRELVEDVKRRPGKANYASIGVGSLSHLTMELVALKTGTEIVHVPYPGSNQAVVALLSGEVDMACLPALSVISQVKAGKLRVIGQTTSRRTSVLPDVPTLAEQGLDIEAGAWNGIVAPAGTPPAILDRLRREVVGALKEPEVVNALQRQLIEVVAGTPEQFVAFMREERDRWAPVIRKAHLEGTQ
ncbi:MAG: Bug family tripartite tricarboxylate transporter substrate binding protein [Bacillota bacterium]